MSGEDPAKLAERLRRIQSVTDAALAHLQIDELLRALLVRVAEALDSDTAAILLLDEERNELVARAARGIEEEVERGTRIPVGRGFAGRVASERRSIAIADVDHADVLNPILREKGVKSLLGTPLMTGERVIGVLHVGTLTPRDFTRDDAELLELVASRVALAIEHGRTYEAEKAAAERLVKLEAVTDAALGALSLDELLDELLDRVRTILEADTCAILLLDEKRNELVARAARGIEEEVEQGVRIPVGAGFAGRVAAERRPVILDEVDHTKVVNPILLDKGIRSMLGAPLMVGDRVHGVIHVGTLTPRKFTREDAELLLLAAQRAAQGLERAQIHDDLRRLDAMRHAFVSVASHELRTPTTAILGAALTLQERADTLAPDVQEQLQRILAEQSQRLATLVDQLLDVSRLEAQAVRISPVSLRIRDHIESIVQGLGEAARSAIQVDVEPTLELHADPMAVERVVTNLLVNALRHGEPPIVVGASRRNGLLAIEVVDHGRGVPEEFQARLFDQFARSHQSSAVQGSGLGLAIARSYARAHGGDLRYDPEFREGARFELTVPLPAEPTVRLPVPEDAG